MFISFDLFLEIHSNKIVMDRDTYLCRTIYHSPIYVTGNGPKMVQKAIFLYFSKWN